MVVIGLIEQVSTDAELKALTGLQNQDFVYHNGIEQLFMFRNNVGDGYAQTNDFSGWFLKDYIKALDFQEYKALRFKEIDERTGELVLNGFSYAGKVFSMSMNAQINIEALNSSRNDPAITYPIEYSTLDDNDNYFVQDATDIHNMYLTALGTKKSYVDSGTVLKDAIRAAINAVEVSQIIDNR